MKKKQLSGFLFRVIAIVPLALMCAALALVYLSYSGSGGIAPQQLGDLNAKVSWKVLLKDNPFYPTRELGSDYAYIRELVDHIQFDLDFMFAGAPKAASVKVDYQVDGALRISRDASSSVPLLVQEYPRLAQASNSFAGPSFIDTRSFQLSLLPYSRVIDSFQSAYSLGVSSKLDLKIAIRLTVETDRKSFTKDAPLSLTIPLDSSVFQISGTPSASIKLHQEAEVLADAKEPGAQTLVFLGAAGVMLLLAASAFVFFTPRRADPWVAELKSILQKCKGSLVCVDADPRKGYAACLPVSDIAGILSIAETSGQPVLHLEKKDAHLFFVSADGILYVYELKMGAKGVDPAGKALQSGPPA